MAGLINRLYVRAEDSIRNNEKLQSLIESVKSKIDQIRNDDSERGLFIGQINLVIRMIKASFQGEYQAFSTQTMVSFVFGLIYFLTPVDLIPDFIPALGLSDDISIIYLIIRTFSSDIEDFKSWEKHQAR